MWFRESLLELGSLLIGEGNGIESTPIKGRTRELTVDTRVMELW